MYGVEQFVAVLNPPQVAILAVGAIEDAPPSSTARSTIAPTLTLTLTCDHRAIDGAEGAEFLRTSLRSSSSPRSPCRRSWHGLRRGGAQDVRFLRDMLHHAYYWKERTPGEGPARWRCT